MNINTTIGCSAVARELGAKVDRAARGEGSVLLFGEAGTWKEEVARAIHQGGSRSAGPFVVATAAGRREGALEAEFFGCERGTQPGTVADRVGLLEAAHGGTLFLDDVAAVPPWLQARLLRVLEEKTLRRVGGVDSRPADFRLICATNRDMRKLVSSGVIRRDFYYRIHVLEIEVPPLRRRREDIPDLAADALSRLAAGSGRPAPRLAAEAVEWLRAYLWPGNLRELRHILERAFFGASEEEIGVDDLTRGLPAGAVAAPPPAAPSRSRRDVDEEKALIEAALRDTFGNRSRAAMLLGISRITLWKKMRRLGMSMPRTGGGGPAVNLV